MLILLFFLFSVYHNLKRKAIKQMKVFGRRQRIADRHDSGILHLKSFNSFISDSSFLIPHSRRFPATRFFIEKNLFFVLDKPGHLCYSIACKVWLFTHEEEREARETVAKNLEITVLLDFYGDMLTAKQREFLDLYYNEDLSLAEIAANVGITRQGVRDAIKRAECQLIEMEARLKLVDRFKEVQKGLEEIMDCATRISAENRKSGLSREINDLTVRIKSIAISLSE